MSTLRQRCGSWLAWAVALAAGCADGGGGKGGDGAAAEGGADTAAVDCTAAPLDCDGRDNDCDGAIDERGERDGRRPGTEDDRCPENCRAVGDEGRGGLADCEDADCAHREDLGYERMGAVHHHRDRARLRPAALRRPRPQCIRGLDETPQAIVSTHATLDCSRRG